MNQNKPEKSGGVWASLREQLKCHVYSRTSEALAGGDRARDEIATMKQLEARRVLMREAFIDGIGGLPPTDTPLRPQVVRKLAFDGYTVESVIFESRPHNYVTSSLYIPNGAAERRGAVVFVCGHFADGRLASEYQIVCQHMVQAGLVVLAVDPIGQGERWSYYDPLSQSPGILPGTAEHDYAGAQTLPLGDGVARYFVHDILRAIDYLAARPEVDPGSIGITGNSGGGTQTSMAMLCDSRIAAAAPATFITSREAIMLTGQAQDAEQIWRGMSALGFDHEDILLAMAPKPVLVLAAQHDFFPIAGTRRTWERAKRLWEMSGEQERLELFVDDCAHLYSVPMARRAASFFAKHLLNTTAEADVDESLIEPRDPTLIWCTKAGQIREQFADARTVYEENRDRLSRCVEARGRMPEDRRKEAALAWLVRKLTEGRRETDFQTRLVYSAPMADLKVQGLLWKSQPDLFSCALQFDADAGGEAVKPLTIALWPGGTSKLETHLAWISRLCKEGRRVLVLDLDGMGALIPDPINGKEINERYGTIHRLTTDLFWLDDSLAALRAYEVLRAIQWAGQAEGADPNGLCLYAEGQTVLYALMAKAAAPEGAVKRLDVSGGMDSMAEWIGSHYYDSDAVMEKVLPGMLPYFDIPDLIRWTSAERL